MKEIRQRNLVGIDTCVCSQVPICSQTCCRRLQPVVRLTLCPKATSKTCQTNEAKRSSPAPAALSPPKSPCERDVNFPAVFQQPVGVPPLALTPPRAFTFARSLLGSSASPSLLQGSLLQQNAQGKNPMKILGMSGSAQFL